MASILDSNPLGYSAVKSNTRKYNTFTSDFNDYMPFNSLDSNYLAHSSGWADAIERTLGKRPRMTSYMDIYEREARNRYLDTLQNARRGGLDRAIDALSVFNYPIAGLVKGFVDNDDKFGRITPLQGLMQGFEAADPFGQGNVRGETLFSDVLESAGWKPKTTDGKIAKGVVGFGLDVALDPSTYLTLGVGAVAKGTGAAGARAMVRNSAKAIAEREGIKLTDEARLADDVYTKYRDKFTQGGASPELAERLANVKRTEVQNTLADVGQVMSIERAREIAKAVSVKRSGRFKLDEKQLETDAINFQRNFNRAMGYDRKGQGMTLSLGNVPFGNKIFGEKLAGKSATLISDANLRRFGDATFGAGYAQARNAIYGSKIGEMFSTVTSLQRLATRAPEELFKMTKWADLNKGLYKDKLNKDEFSQTLVKSFNLTPIEAKSVMNLMQDASKWNRVKDIFRLKDTEEASDFRREIIRQQSDLRTRVESLRATRNDVDALLTQKESALRTAEDTLTSLMRERDVAIASSNARESARIDAEINRANREVEQLQKEREEVRAGFRGDEIAEKARNAEAAIKALESEKVAKLLEFDANTNLTKRQLEEKYWELQNELTRIEKMAQSVNKPRAEKTEVTYDDYVDEMQNTYRNLQEYFVNRKAMYGDAKKLRESVKAGNPTSRNAVEVQIRAMEEKLGGAGQYQNKLVNMLNDLLFDGRKAITTEVHPDALGEVLKRFDEYHDIDAIRKFIEERPKLYTEEARKAQRIAANVIGYKDWNEVYHKPMAELTALRDKTHVLSSAQIQYWDELTEANVRRNALLNALYTMGIKDLDDFEKLSNQKHLNDIMDEAGNLFNSIGASGKSTRDMQFENWMRGEGGIELDKAVNDAKGLRLAAGHKEESVESMLKGAKSTEFDKAKARNYEEDAGDYVIRVDRNTGEEYYAPAKSTDLDVRARFTSEQRKSIGEQIVTRMSKLKLDNEMYASLKWDKATPIQQSFIRDALTQAQADLITVFRKEFDLLSPKDVDKLITSSIKKTLDKGYFKNNVSIKEGKTVSFVHNNKVQLGNVIKVDGNKVTLEGAPRADGTPNTRVVSTSDVVPTTSKPMRDKINARMAKDAENKPKEDMVNEAKEKTKQLIKERVEIGSKVSFKDGRRIARGEVIDSVDSTLLVRDKRGVVHNVNIDNIVSAGRRDDSEQILREVEAKREAIRTQLDDIEKQLSTPAKFDASSYDKKIAENLRAVDELNASLMDGKSLTDARKAQVDARIAERHEELKSLSNADPRVLDEIATDIKKVSGELARANKEVKNLESYIDTIKTGRATKEEVKFFDDFLAQMDNVFGAFGKASTENMQGKVYGALLKRASNVIDESLDGLDRIIKKNDFYDVVNTKLAQFDEALKDLPESAATVIAQKAKRSIRTVINKNRKAMERVKQLETDLAGKAFKRDVLVKDSQSLHAKKRDYLAQFNGGRELAKIQEDYARRIDEQQRLIEELNSVTKTLADSVKYGDVAKLDELADDVAKMEEALASDDAFEAYMTLKLGEEEVADIIRKFDESNPTYFAFQKDATLPEKVKQISMALRHDFIEMGKKEVGIKKLKADQLDANMWNYLPRVLTPEGQEMFRKLRGNEEKYGVGLTKDFGYGVKFNPHGKSRNIRFINTPEGRINNPTIEQLNDHFAPMLGGKNAYVDNLTDLYLSRALKHNELMYDDMYMRNMLEMFGKGLNKDFGVDKGFKAVMNYGMMKEFVNEAVSLKVSLHVSEMIGEMLREQMVMTGRKLSSIEVQDAVNRYMKSTVARDEIKQVRGAMLTETLNKAGIDEKILTDFKVPMVELEKHQIRGLYEAHAEIMDRYHKSIYGSKKGRLASAIKYGDDDSYGRVMKSIDRINAFRQPQIKQMNDAIVQKANQARKLQIAKDESRFLQVYDKLTHLLKLNMTTIVPAFHLRNKMANMYLNWLNIGRDAFDFKLQKKAIEVIRAEGKGLDRDVLVIKRPDGSMDNMTWTEVYAEARALGVIDEGFFAKDIGASAKTKGVIKGLPSKFDPTDSDNFLLYKLGGRVGNIIENGDRLTHFVALIRSGVDVDDAARQVREFLFDYSDLTRFEQNVMKRIIPFYTWLRKNSALQLDSMLERTNKMQYVAKTFNGIEGMSNEEDQIDPRFISDFAEDWIQTPFTSADGEPILWSPNLPINDLSRIPDPFNLKKTIKNIFTQMNPMIKAPAEQIENHQAFFDSEIVEEGASLDDNVKARADHLASHNALYNVVKNFIKKDGLDGGLNLLATTTGVKFATYDVQGYINNHLLYKEQQTDFGIEEIVSKAEDLIGTGVSLAVNKVGASVNKNKPTPSSEYIGALRPISQATYESLPKEEQALYTPPTNSQAYALNLRATKMEKEAYEKTGVVQKFLWTLFDGVGQQDFEIGNVERVIDGDTFELRVGDETKTIRMLLVDTPETVKKNTPVMPFGKEASDYSKGKLIGKDVKIVFDGTRMDAYNRTLGYVVMTDTGVDYNQELIEQGYGSVRFRMGDYKREKAYDQAETRASEAKRGIWSVPNYSQLGGDEDYDISAYKRYMDMLGK